MIAEWDGDLFLVEMPDIVSERLSTSLLDVVEVAREFLYLLTIGEHLHEGVRELGEKRDGIVG